MNERIILWAVDERKVLRRLFVAKKKLSAALIKIQGSRATIHPLSLGHFGDFAIAMNQMSMDSNFSSTALKKFLGSAGTVSFSIVLCVFVCILRQIQCEELFTWLSKNFAPPIMMYYSAPVLDMRPSTINIYSFRPAIREHLGQPDGTSKSDNILHISTI